MRITLAFVVFILSAAVGAQTPRSHVERFSTPEARAARVEVESGEKLAKSPNDPVLLNERALARLRLQKYADALEDLKRAVALDPKSAEFRANYGYALWKVNRFAEAVEAEREALRLDEKNYTANYQLGRFLLRSGDRSLLREAAEKLKRALELDARQYEVRFELIAVFRELGDTASALGQLDILQDARPSDARVVYVTALLHVDRNDPKSAEESFRDAVRKDPNLYGAWQDLGLLMARQNRWSDAVDAFGELSRRQQNSVDAAYFFALSLFNSKKTDEAEREARRALRLDAGSANAHTLLGIILSSRGDKNAEATESLIQAVALSPNNFDAVFYLGRLQYLARDFVAAQRNLETAAGLQPKNIEAKFFLGSTREALGESDKALGEYQEIVKLDPNSYFGKIGLGALLVKQGKTDEAALVLGEAVKLEPASFEANWAFGRALMLQEKFLDALIPLETATRLQPNRTDARYQFAIALRRLGRADEAKREFDLVEKLNREFREGKNPQ